MKRRIIRADSLSWAIQDWQEGGDIISRGRFAGQVKRAGWKVPQQFFTTLTWAAKSFFHEIVGDLPQGEQLTGEQIVTQIEAAEKRTMEYVSGLLEKMKTETLIGILQERGYKVSDGKKGRKGLIDDEAPEEDQS